MQNYLGEICAVFTAMSWASAVICFRKAGDSLNPIALNFFKTLFACICFLILYPIIEGPTIPQMPQRSWWILTISGFIGITIADALFLSALKRLGASLSAIVATSYSLNFIVMGYFFLGETLEGLQLVGAGLIICSIILVSLRNSAKTLERIAPKTLLIGISIGVLCEIFMVSAVVMVRDILREGPLFFIIVFRFAVGSVFSLPLLFGPKLFQNLKESLSQPKVRFWMILGSFSGPFLSTITWLSGFKYGEAAKVAVLNQLSTVFIFILAAVFLKEPFNSRRVMAIILAFTGALLVNLH